MSSEPGAGVAEDRWRAGGLSALELGRFCCGTLARSLTVTSARTESVGVAAMGGGGGGTGDRSEGSAELLAKSGSRMAN